jgi:hypothetical protein
MKQLLLLALLSSLLFACEKEPIEKQPESCIETCEVVYPILGEWELIETYMDPGDGSGTFQPVNSNKIITFSANGTISSNENICDIATNPNTSNSPSSGTYSNNSINVNCHVNQPWDITFQQTGNILILNYPCICGCQAKYRRL